jgi:hypothetical protein
MKTWLQAPGFSPKGFVVRAAALALVYGLLSLAGLRETMSVLSLTYPEGSSREWSAICCVTYLVSYFLWILGVPILLLAAGLMQGLTWFQARRRKPG